MLIINKLNVDVACSFPRVSGWKQPIQMATNQAEMLRGTDLDLRIPFAASLS